jgi:hypothetical protein
VPCVHEREFPGRRVERRADRGDEERCLVSLRELLVQPLDHALQLAALRAGAPGRLAPQQGHGAHHEQRRRHPLAAHVADRDQEARLVDEECVVEVAADLARDADPRRAVDILALGEKRRLLRQGINLPDTALDLPALSDKDRVDLAVVARHADLVGLSFAQRAADVEALLEALRGDGAPEPGLVLKIETRQGFENLPELVFAAMAARAAGVMIARGDLAVECGYERLAEVQEEILWLAEAAHVPVIWATQVLESLAKTGRPSRAEITDAAMGERAECVMLNKGAHVLDAIRMLDDILRRMQAHQAKKRPLLRALHSFRAPAARSPGPGAAPVTARAARPSGKRVASGAEQGPEKPDPHGPEPFGSLTTAA